MKCWLCLHKIYIAFTNKNRRFVYKDTTIGFFYKINMNFVRVKKAEMKKGAAKIRLWGWKN